MRSNNLTTYFIVLFDLGSYSTFIGYTTHEYIVRYLIKNDNLNNYRVDILECGSIELFSNIYNNYGFNLDYDMDELQLFISRDQTKTIISSINHLDRILRDTNMYEDFLLTSGKALYRIRYMSKFMLNGEEVYALCKKILYEYLCDAVFRYNTNADIFPFSSENNRVDKIKVLARYGYIGTVTEYV